MRRIWRLAVTSAMVAMVLGLNLACPRQETAQTSRESFVEPQKDSQIGEQGVVFEITDEKQFEELVLNSDKVALVDFWAPWCRPCLMVSPRIAELASEYAGRAVFAKGNVDHLPTLARRYQIQFIPTIMYFKEGQVVETLVGVQDKSAYRNVLDRHIGAGGQE